MKIRGPFLFLLLVCFCLRSAAQEKLSRNYTVKDGLASNNVYHVLVDNKGFVWLATDAGVSMFDGTAFTNFSANDGLADNDVLSMFEDNEGRIWFVCFNKQPCFYYKGRFFNADNFKELQRVKNYNWHIAFTDLHDVWLSGSDRIYRFRDNKITEFKLPVPEGARLLTRISTTIYAIADSQFYSFNEKGNNFELYPGLKMPFLGSAGLLDIGNGNFIVVDHIEPGRTYVYKYTIDPAKHTVVKKLCDVYNKETITNLIDPESNLLRLTFADNSVIEKDILTDSLKTVAEYKMRTIVSSGSTDHQGNKWVTLLHGGIQMFPKTRADVVSIPPEINTASTYYSIIQANGDIIIGNSDNTLLFINNGKLQKTAHENFYSGNNRIIDMKMDKHNKLWLGTDKGVCIYDPGKKKFKSINIVTNIKDIKYDAVNDVMLFASSENSFVISCSNPSQVLPVNNDRTICIAGDLADTCWYGTLNGLYIYHNKTSIPDTSLSSQFNSRVISMQTDKQKRLWVGTSSNGVFVVQHNRIIFHFTTAEGLTSNICKNIFIDGDNEAWISTNLGVSHVITDQQHFAITKYNDKNCLVDNNVNDVLVLQDTVYVVSSTGIAFFNKRNNSSIYPFPVYITRVKIGNNEMAGEDSVFSLSSNHSTLSISFSGLSYLSNGEIKYEYYVKELNEKPLVTKSNAVTYSGLAPGTYNFYVSAVDVFGNRSIQPAHITFTIVPEWYQLTWLRWAGILAVILIAVFITFWYSRRIEERKRLQAELNQTISMLELEAIHMQINPHFIFNCLNAIQNAVYQNNTETASYFINRFAKLMRQALMLSKETFISIDEEFNFINNYLEVEKLRHNNSFEYTIEIDNKLNKSIPGVPAFVLQPFIENAINHGIKYLKNEKGVISLKFIRTDKLEIHLDDNGIGINASRKIKKGSIGQHSSKGIELMQARVESLNKIYQRNIQIKITDKTELNSNEHGTTIIISLDLL